jgi:hypothetical protein
MPLGAKSTEDPQFGNPQALFKQKPFRIREKTLPFGIPTVCTGQSSLPMHPFGQ